MSIALLSYSAKIGTATIKMNDNVYELSEVYPADHLNKLSWGLQQGHGFNAWKRFKADTSFNIKKKESNDSQLELFDDEEDRITPEQWATLKDMFKEGMSPNYREPYSYRQNTHETFDDTNKPSSALELVKGFDLLWVYDRARKGWPEMERAPMNEPEHTNNDLTEGVVKEDIGGAANLSSGSIGGHTPENALAVRQLNGSSLASAKRGTSDSVWDSAYQNLSEASEEIEKLLIDMRSYLTFK